MRDDVVSVVAGGWSFREVSHDRVPGRVVAVNDAGLELKCKVDCIVTMDRLWTEHRWGQLQQRRPVLWARRSAVQNVRPTDGDREWLRVYENNEKTVIFDTDPFRLNGTNSGVCALNKAWQYRPRTLYLFGFDMCRSPEGVAYWYPPYPWVTQAKGATSNGRYDRWAMEFRAIAAQFDRIGTKVYNVSPHSKIIEFPRMSAASLGLTA